MNSIYRIESSIAFEDAACPLFGFFDEAGDSAPGMPKANIAAIAERLHG